MKTTLLAAVMATACGAVAIGQTDPNKPWLMLLDVGPQETASDGPILPLDGSRVIYAIDWPTQPALYSQTPDQDRVHLADFPSSVFGPMSIHSNGVTMSGDVLLGGVISGSTTMSFEFDKAGGISVGPANEDFYLTVSRNGAARLWIASPMTRDSGPSTELHHPSGVYPLPAESGGLPIWHRVLDEDGDTVAGWIEKQTATGYVRAPTRWSLQDGLEVLDSAFVGFSAVSHWISADGQTIGGVVANLDSPDWCLGTNTHAFLWSSDSTTVLTEFSITRCEHVFFSDDQSRIYAGDPTTLDANYRFDALFWRQSVGARPLAQVMIDEYGLALPKPRIRVTSASADGRIITGVFYDDEYGSTPFVTHLPDPIPGDLTKDWEVTGADLAVFLAAWGSDDRRRRPRRQRRPRAPPRKLGPLTRY